MSVDLLHEMLMGNSRAGDADESPAAAPIVSQAATQVQTAQASHMLSMLPSGGGSVSPSIGSPMSPSGAGTSNPNYTSTMNGLLARYGLQVGNKQNLFLPEPGTDGFFGQHPNLSRAIEGGVMGAAMTQSAPTIGGNISNVASSLLGGPMARQQALMQRNVGVPMQQASQIAQLQHLGAQTDLETAQAQMDRAHAQYWQNYTRRRFSGQPYPVSMGGKNVYAQTDDITGEAVVQKDAQGNPMEVPSGFRGTGKSPSQVSGVMKTEASRRAWDSLDSDTQQAYLQGDPDAKATFNQQVLGWTRKLGSAATGARVGTTKEIDASYGSLTDKQKEDLKQVDNLYQKESKYDDFNKWQEAHLFDVDPSNWGTEYDKYKQSVLSKAEQNRQSRTETIKQQPARQQPPGRKASPMAPPTKTKLSTPSARAKVTIQPNGAVTVE